MRRQPAQSRSQQKVQQIVEAARRVLVARGLEHFTTNHVAAEAGCNISTLYRYFPEKNEIIKQLYLDWLEDEKQVNLGALQLVECPVDPAEFVADLFHQHLEKHDDDAHKLAIELTKALYLNSDVRQIDEAYEREFVASVGAHLSHYTAHTFSEEQIAYVLKLAVSLLIMINQARPEQREALEAMASQTLKSTVRAWY